MTRRMYFIGVTTAQSSIHRIFPAWAELGGIEDAELAGIDIRVDAPAAAYRSAVSRILEDPASWGGLVTTHKVNIYRHAGDLFTGFDEDGARLGEVNCIVRRSGRLEGLATDTLTAGLALREILGAAPFTGSALIFGAGGAAVALAVNLYRFHRPAEIILTDVSGARLQQVQGLTPARTELVSGAADHDRLLGAMPAGSLIVNATGMGKDRPGSPITEGACFPADATAWDFNYRGNLVFLDYARRAGARAVDGWNYFLHGWSEVMSRVYGFELTADVFARMQAAAKK